MNGPHEPCTVMGWQLLWAAVLLLFAAGLEGCVVSQQCGWNAICDGSQCQCQPGYNWSHNDRDCLNPACEDNQCLECPLTYQCRRCVDYIDEGTGNCLEECETEYILRVEGNFVGKVCNVPEESMLTVYVAIIVGVSVGLLITAALVLLLYWKLSKKDKDPKFRANILTRIVREKAVTPNGTLQRPIPIPTFDNHAYDNSDIYRRPGEVSKFFHQMAVLRPHNQTFLVMLQEAQLRCRDLPLGDNRISVYRNVIHQLCRVVTLLNADESQMTTPSDGPALMTWAEKILTNYLKVQSQDDNSDSNPETISTFNPDFRLVSHGQATATDDQPAAAYTYERCSGDEHEAHDEDGSVNPSTVDLTEEYTDPIEV